jgi:hypothetical protein
MSLLNARTVFWWLSLFVAPIILLTIELFHPAHFTFAPAPGMFQYLSQAQPYNPVYQALGYFGPNWWFTLHMIQTPTVCLFTVGLFWLVAGASENALSNITAWLARIATFVFIIYYTVLDAIGGIGLGRSLLLAEDMRTKGQLSADQYAGVITFLNNGWVDPWSGGVGSVVSQTGSWAAFIATILIAITLRLRAKAPWGALALFVAGGWLLQESHAALTGPEAFGLFAAAGLWMWVSGIRLK